MSMEDKLEIGELFGHDESAPTDEEAERRRLELLDSWENSEKLPDHVAWDDLSYEDLQIQNETSENVPLKEQLRQYEELNSELINKNTKLESKLGNLKARVKRLDEGYKRKKEEVNELKGMDRIRSKTEEDEKKSSQISPLVSGDRPLPHNTESETVVIGTILNDSSFLPSFNELSAGDRGDFYHPAHATIMRVAREMGPGFDLVSLADNLEKKGVMDQVGGTHYLMKIAERAADINPAFAVVNHSNILKRDGTLRRLIRFSGDIYEEAYEMMTEKGIKGKQVDPMEYIAQKSSEMLDLLPRNERMKLDNSGLVDIVQEEFEEHVKRGYKPKYSTGYPKLDRLTHGIQPAFILCGANTKHGKSSLALNVARNLHHQGQRSLIFCRENPKSSIYRLAAMDLDIDSEIFMYADKEPPEEVTQRIREYLPELKKKMNMEFHTEFNPDNIISRARVMKQRYPQRARMVVVDSIQSMTAPEGMSKAQYYEDSCMKLQDVIVGELEMNLWVNSQLKTNSQGTKKLMKSGPDPSGNYFSDCGALPEEADQSFYLFRLELYPEVARPGQEGVMKVIPYRRRVGGIDKNGSDHIWPVSQFNLHFDDYRCLVSSWDERPSEKE